jgi:metal-dependent amidase/aminoacylase/carboxypeptidase family protein
MWLGTKIEDESKQLHSPYFDFDDNVLSTGVKVFINTALDLLEENGD